MFAYLNKKIQMPNGTKVKSVAWDKLDDWIAVGGTNGMLKIFLLDSKAVTRRPRGAVTAKRGDLSSATFASLQALDGHSGDVHLLSWNNLHCKLASADTSGLVSVWGLVDGVWTEEMMNNRKKSSVKSLRWCADGSRICITYEDGAIIVGNAEGKRIWSKELKETLQLVEWSPCGQHILFGNSAGDVLVHDNQGSLLARMVNYTVPPDVPQPGLVAIEWYDRVVGVPEQNAPSLAVAYNNGRVQVSRWHGDDNPVLIDTGLDLHCVKWSPDGSVLTVSGTQRAAKRGDVNMTDGQSGVDNKDIHMLQFYSNTGKHIRSLKVAGIEPIANFAWECSGLRIVIAIDGFVYFANVRPAYQHIFFQHTLVYPFTRPDRADKCVYFWDTITDERRVRYVHSLVASAACDQFCALVTTVPNRPDKSTVIICNNLGLAMSTQQLDFIPTHLSMNDTHLVATTKNAVYVWEYLPASTGIDDALQALIADPKRTRVSNQTKSATMAAFGDSAGSFMVNKSGAERLFHIDDGPSQSKLQRPDVKAVQDQALLHDGGSSSYTASLLNSMGMEAQSILDPSRNTPNHIVAIDVADSCFVVARASGSITRYQFPSCAEHCKLVVRTRPERVKLNCDASKVAVVDLNGTLTLLDIGSTSSVSSPSSGSSLTSTDYWNTAGFERQNVWSIEWAKDAPEMFATMEKGRLYIFRHCDPEEPISCPSSVCELSDLSVTTAELDQIMIEPDLASPEHVVMLPTKLLRDTRTILDTCPISEAFALVDKTPHSHLWRLIAEQALRNLDFLNADKAFVKCQDLDGILFTKTVQLMVDAKRQLAEVEVYCKRFDVAQELYRKMGRDDFAVELRMKLGDYLQALSLLQRIPDTTDRQYHTLYQQLGEYYYDRFKPETAFNFFAKTQDVTSMVKCVLRSDDFEPILPYVDSMPDGAPYLLELGRRLAAAGYCHDSVKLLIKAGDVKGAIDACVLLNQWGIAVKLAQDHSMPQVQLLLSQYGEVLKSEGKWFEAIDVHHKAGQHSDAVRLLGELAEKYTRDRKDPLLIKQAYVLLGREAELEHRKEFGEGVNDAAYNTIKAATSTAAEVTKGSTAYNATASMAATTQATLKSMLDADVSSNRHMELPWRGAEAYHFWLLAQRQLHNGELEAGVRTACRLKAYEDIVGAVQVHSLIAFASAYCGWWNVCSEAFVALESLPASSRAQRGDFKALAINIFMAHRPVDPQNAIRNVNCTNCQTPNTELDNSCCKCSRKLPVCIATGASLIGQTAFKCKHCAHDGIDHIMRSLRFCPLCHQDLHSIQ